ncbi:MAG: hypothetical protein V1673_01120 [Candidatus Omnitrophota bacterium]
MKDHGVAQGLLHIFRLLGKITATVIITALLLEGGVRVVLYFSLNHYLMKTLKQPYGRIMQTIGNFTLLNMGSQNRFDPICYFLPKAGFFRGPQGRIDCPKEKEEGEIRIICIGDSTTYGFAINYDDSWVYLLGKMLAEKYPEKKIRVLNAGLPGAISKQVKRFFQFHIVAYQSDILIWRENDAAATDTYFVSNTFTDSVRLFLWHCLYESRVFRVVCVLLDHAEPRRPNRPANSLFNFLTGRFPKHPQRLSEGFDSDFSIVEKIAREHGVRHVLQVEYLYYNKGVISGGFKFRKPNDRKDIVYLLSAFEKYHKENPAKTLFVDPIHLTEIGEAITAEEVFEFLVRKKWIETFP